MTPLVVLLVTKSRLGLVENDSTFIPSLFHRVFENAEIADGVRVDGIDVLVAVIDKLPYPNRGEPWKGKIGGFLKDAGFEGISVFTLESKTAAPDLWSDRVQAQAQETMTIQQRCTLSFLVRTSPKNDSEKAIQWPGRPWTSHLFQLPVANTLFHNGEISTLFAERWVFRAFEALEKTNPLIRAIRTKRAMLPQQLLHLPHFSPRLRLETSLIPITSTRLVAAATGNIIRQLHHGPNVDPKGTVPASRELEEVISRKIESDTNLPKKLDIWALVTPRENRISWPRVWPEQLQTFVESGSRIHKVLSGGGGWGPKEGLLALDPDSDYSSHGHEPSGDFGEKTFFPETVKVGDAVTFFTNFPRSLPEVCNEPFKAGSLRQLEASTHSFCVGSLPSRMDELVDSNWASNKSKLPHEYLFIKGHFGMLSEHGMSVRIESQCPDASEYYGTEPWGAVVQTKLDTPYTSYYRPSKLGDVKQDATMESEAVSHGKQVMRSETSPLRESKPNAEVEFEAGIRGTQVGPSGTRTEKLIWPEISFKNREPLKPFRLKAASANPELPAGGKSEAKVRAKRLIWPETQPEEATRSPNSEGSGLPNEKTPSGE